MPPPSFDVDPADLGVCRETLRTGSRTFLAASLVLPRSVRDPATALYAFCRLADDMVDLGADPRAAIRELEARLDAALAGRPAAHPVDRAFAAVSRSFAIPRTLPAALLDGLAWDAAGRRYEDLPALRAYAVRVAGTVGAMMTLVMGVRRPAVVARAIDLGVAMQLTNIARDVGEDARAGRLYLPRAWLRGAGVDPDRWLRAPAFDRRIASVVARLLHVADLHYRRATGAVRDLPPLCRPGIHAARILYGEIGREVERRGHDSVGGRAVVSGRRKLLLAPAATAASLRRSPSPPAPVLPEGRFLLDAVADTPAADPVGTAGVAGRVVWVIDLFSRLERQDRLGRAGA